MITLRTEIDPSSTGSITEVVAEPEGWADWSPERRRKWCHEALEVMIFNMVGSSFDYPEMAADDEREEAAAEAVRAFRAAVDLPPAVGDCTVCGATDAQCRQVIKNSSASLSCCSTCKSTKTHPGM
jgi:hypothetical protein